MCIIEQIDGFLWRHGLIHARTRTLLRNIFLLSSGLFAIGLIVLPLTGFFFWCGLSALLTCCSFYDLIRIVQRFFPLSAGGNDSQGQKSAQIVKKRVLIRSQFKLFIFAIFVYVALVGFHANPFALASGFSVSVIIIAFSLLGRHEC